jgi:collagen type III alpha
MIFRVAGQFSFAASRVSAPPEIVVVSTSSNAQVDTNPTDYQRAGYNTYLIQNTSELLAPYTTDNSTGNPDAGECTLQITATAAFDLHIALIAGGGGGGGGKHGSSRAMGGGGGGGECKAFTIKLEAGTHSLVFSVGGGGRGASCGTNGVAVSSTSEGAGGYGHHGNETSLTIGGTTYTAVGGTCGSRINGAPVNNAGAYGGGSGGTWAINVPQPGSTGSVNIGGATPEYRSGGSTVSYFDRVVAAAGGGGAGGNGSNGGVWGTATQTITGNGGDGGAGVSSTTFPVGLQFSTARAFCGGGGGGANIRSTHVDANENIGGSGNAGGGPGGSGNKAGGKTRVITNATGFGGGGGGGAEPTSDGGSGANGAVFLAFASAVP